MTSVILVGLIGFGLAHLGAKLDGPFGLAAALRAWVQHRPHLPRWLPVGIGCVFCQAFWWTLVAVGGCGLPLGRVFVLTWLAGYGLAVFGFLYTGH